MTTGHIKKRVNVSWILLLSLMQDEVTSVDDSAGVENTPTKSNVQWDKM